MNKGKEKALCLAKEKFQSMDFIESCSVNGLSEFKNDSVILDLFGNKAILKRDTLDLLLEKDGKPAKLEDNILLLHYLNSSINYKQTGEFVSFRKFPGGQFYLTPFQNRTVIPLVKKYGNNIDELKNRLATFDWTALDYADFSAKIHVFGNVYIALVYHIGDEEFPPSADFLFDRAAIHVFSADEASVITDRVCLSLLY